jgi:hypothetical protein
VESPHLPDGVWLGGRSSRYNSLMVRASMLALLLVLLSASAGAQSFDPSAASLPANFKPDDFVAVYRTLLAPPKGEFETTEQYEARRKPAAGVYAFGGLLSIVEYDADKALFRVRFYREKAIAGYSRARESMLQFSHTSETVRTYTASNALGGMVKASEIKEDRWGVLIPDSGGESEFFMAVPPDRARELKPRLELLGIVRVGPESTPDLLKGVPNTDDTGYEHTKATFQSPRDVSIDYHAIRASVIGVWLYDKKTGEILGRYDARGWPLNADGSKAPVTQVIFSPAADESDVTRRAKKGMTSEEVLHIAKPLTPKIDKKRGSRELWKFGDWYTFELEAGILVGLTGRTARLF